MKDPADINVLIVDDEPEMRAALSETLKRQGYRFLTAENGEEALRLIEDETFDLVVSDVRMPKLSGPELLKAVRDVSPETRVVMITAYGTIDNAVETMKAGASDYLLKPFSADVLVSTVNRALMSPAGTPAPADAGTVRSSLPMDRRIVTENEKMKELLTFVENVAYSKSTVLISGETGTGKEMFARYIHACSPRADQPFMAVNCAALPEGLLETELFGHEKGAFTGADTRKDGKFELAHKGTLLLDEVTEMGMPLQAKLLRVLQEHEIDKVGGRQPIPVDVRIVATTNRDPRQLIAENKFREDLYYRLNVIPLKLPPLRERLEDIPLLADHFIKKHGQENHRPVKSISSETLALLKKYRWGGNVRELENVIERAVLLCPGDTVQPAHLFLEDAAGNAGKTEVPALSGTIYDMERELIFQTLGEVGGNKTKAAEQLGISIRTLRNKLTEYKEKGLTPPE
ncbi:MAG: sigma-54-dependent Fis family transcriptional regulator [Nitrospina sp.]|nr:sigma-54-dependent Fis family transcriptional regulator [Nitrospina sp.]